MLNVESLVSTNVIIQFFWNSVYSSQQGKFSSQCGPRESRLSNPCLQVQPSAGNWTADGSLRRVASISDATWNDTGAGAAMATSVASKGSPDSLTRALDLIRRGSHPLDMYPTPHLLAHLRPRLERIMALCWQEQSPRLKHQISIAESPSTKPHLSLDVMLTSLALLPICELPAWADHGGRPPPTPYGKMHDCPATFGSLVLDLCKFDSRFVLSGESRLWLHSCSCRDAKVPGLCGECAMGLCARLWNQLIVV